MGTITFVLGASTAWGQCNDPANYVPRVAEHTPPVRFGYMLHVVAPKTPVAGFQGQFSPDSAAHLEFLQIVVSGAAQRFKENVPMRLPTASEFIADARVRPVCEGVVFEYDDENWDLFAENKAGERARRAGNLYQKFVLNNPDARRDVLHVFVGEGKNGALMATGIACGIGCGTWAAVCTWYQHYLNGRNHWLPAMTLAHEFGHCMGLYHTVGKGTPLNDHCDDTPTYPQNPGCWNGDSCSNNLMDYNADQRALTACQLGRIHYHIAGKQGDFHKVVVPDWCENTAERIVIAENVEWNGDKKLHGGVQILPGATLTVRCTLHLPQGAEILLRPGAKLVVDGGTLTNLCKHTWKGVRLANKKMNFDDHVVFINGGKIENDEKTTSPGPKSK